MKALVTLCLLLLANDASAKCINVRQEVSGVVADSSGQPIEGAIVRASWDERGTTKVKSEQSGTNGRFTVYVIFDTYSGSGLLGEDKCDGKLEELSVRASKPGFADIVLPLRRSDGPINIRLLLRKEAFDG